MTVVFGIPVELHNLKRRTMHYEVCRHFFGRAGFFFLKDPQDYHCTRKNTKLSDSIFCVHVVKLVRPAILYRPFVSYYDPKLYMHAPFHSFFFLWGEVQCTFHYYSISSLSKNKL